MKFQKTITMLVLIVVILSTVASIYGIVSDQGSGKYEIQSFRGEKVTIYGKGLYQQDSVSVVAQGVAQDIVTIVLGIPLLILSLYFSRKGLLKSRLLLTGTLGYFLYTYISYTFLWMYNSFFLMYVVLMSASFFAFLLLMISFDLQKLSQAFDRKLPVKFIGGFQIFVALAVGMLWLGKIFPALQNGTVPVGLEHYTTLVIQGLDLGFIVPTAIISGVMILKRRPWGYLLSSIIIMKALTLGTAVTAMIIGQANAGVKMGLTEMLLFPIFNIVAIYAAFLLLKNIKEPRKF